MFPIAKAILQGALARDECRGAHYKPEFDMPGLTADDPAERRRQAEEWCDTFEARNKQWLKTTIATYNGSPSHNSPTKTSTRRSSRPGRGCTAWSVPR